MEYVLWARMGTAVQRWGKLQGRAKKDVVSHRRSMASLAGRGRTLEDGTMARFGTAVPCSKEDAVKRSRERATRQRREKSSGGRRE
jgi:hypothetical protein